MADLNALDLIERKAAAFEFEAEQAAAAPLPGEPQPVDEVAELAEILTYARDLATPLLPYLPGVYTEESIAALAKTGVPLLNKHGITLGGLGEFFGEEIRFLMVAGPLALATYFAHKQWKAEKVIEAQGPQPEVQRPAPVAPVRAMVAVQDTGGMLRMQGA